MRGIDLHVHSTCSDGTNTPAELVELALAKNLKAIALTDHDTIDGLDEILSCAKNKDLEIVPGIELSTEYFGRDIHMLGLYINPCHPEFLAHLEKFRESRDNRNRKMCELLAQQGIDITYESLVAEFPDSVLTRSHYACYLLSHGYVKSRKEAFERYVGDHCKAFVPREKITPMDAIRLIRVAGGIPVLAHPILYRLSDATLDKMVAELKEAGLMGIEGVYSTYAPSEERYIKRLAAKYDLLVTGGSDYHGGNKPDIQLGNGRGSLFVPEELLDRLKEAYLSEYNNPKANSAILFFDLDGTLLNDEKTISPLTRETLENCVKAGHRFAISSGRPLASIRKLVDRLHLEDLNPLASSFNGSLVYDYETGKNLMECRLSTDIVEKVRNLISPQGIHCHSYSESEILSEKETPELLFYAKYVNLPYRLVDNLAAPGEEPYKMLIVTLDNRQLLEDLKIQLEEILGDRVQCLLSNDMFLEVLPANSGKGAALTFLCEHYGISKEHSFAFADAENDISMLREARYGVCLLNGQKNALAAADYVTFTDNNHEGLVPYLKKLLP